MKVYKMSFIDIGNNTYINKKYIVKIEKQIKYINMNAIKSYEITLTSGEKIEVYDEGYTQITKLRKGL